jgi:hypothetical protein
MTFLESIPGVKLAYLIAGFAGGVVSLTYVRPLNKWQGCLAIITGALGSNYLTPMLMHYAKFDTPLEHGSAFIIGLCAMNIIPGIIFLSEKWKKDPKVPGQQNDTGV